MEGDSLKFNFETALIKIDTLTKHNNELLDKVDELESQLEKAKLTVDNEIIEPYIPQNKFHDVSKEADAAMKRFTTKLRKGLSNAKSKQSQGEPV